MSATKSYTCQFLLLENDGTSQLLEKPISESDYKVCLKFDKHFVRLAPKTTKRGPNSNKEFIVECLHRPYFGLL